MTVGVLSRLQAVSLIDLSGVSAANYSQISGSFGPDITIDLESIEKLTNSGVTAETFRSGNHGSICIKCRGVMREAL